MPMYREWVPRQIRPWIYVLMLVMFQLTGCIYLGAASQITGTTGLMRDDVMFIGICNVIGVNMPFPFLFRYKFRFTNRQLLLNAALVIAACNLLALWVCNSQLSALNSQLKIIPLCVLSFLAGYFKLCGTFECASNIQLWMAPGRDFKIFFPLLYIMVVGDIFLQSWLAGIITYYYSWQMMNWLITGLMLLVVLIVYTLTKNFRMMKPMPLLSMDWLGCALWSMLFMEVVWLFNYGEYYNWWDGRMWRVGLLFTLVTFYLTIQRARHIRHPYIDLAAFRYKTLLPLLALYFIAEWLDSTPKVLQNTLTGGVLHWGWMTTNVFELIGWLGTVAIERLYVPVFVRAFGYAIYFTALTIYLEELMPFHHFFMGLTITGLDPMQALLVSIKQLYGVTCLLGVAFLLLLLLWNVQPVRSTMKKIPSWHKVARHVRRLQKKRKESSAF